jgi:hypothetical protein
LLSGVPSGVIAMFAMATLLPPALSVTRYVKLSAVVSEPSCVP